jgi:predicted DNA-binding protein (UPF0251 family)
MALKPDAKRKNKTEIIKSEIGRFDQARINQVQSLSGLGLTTEEIANSFGISKATFERRCHVQPELYDALKKGRALARAKVAKAAYNMATDERHPVMTMFWLRAQAGWLSKDRDGDAGEASSPMTLEHLALMQIAGMETEDILERLRVLESIPVSEYKPLPILELTPGEPES